MKKFKVTGLRESIQDSDSSVAADFLEQAKEILASDEFLKLDQCEHHVDISRQQHCLNVAYYAFAAAKRLGLDARSTVRAGLLHDLFYYNYRETDLGLKHSYVHPIQALHNASELVDLNDKEREIIKNHMWPLCVGVPHHPETYLVSLVDKYCATIEAADYSLRLIRTIYRRYFARA